jgi:hypothetical protein
MARQARSQARAGFDAATRQSLVEADIDGLEQCIRDLTASQHRIQQILVGVLISVATGSVLLAINLVVQVPK